MTDDQTPNNDSSPPSRDLTSNTTPKPAEAGTPPKPGASASAPKTSSEQSPKDGFGAVTAWMGKALRIIFAPLVWLLRPLVFRVSMDKNLPKVYFTSFSTLVYLWPIMVVGWINTMLYGWIDPAVLGWVWITVMLVVILCIGSDTDRNKTIVIILVGLLLWIGGLLIEEKQGIPVISRVYDHFAGYEVSFNPGTAQVFSVATLIILIFVVLAAWFDGRYEITTREISHKRLFRTSDSLPRAAKRIKRDWRDLTEVFLGLGAGDLIVLDSNKNIVMRIPNVPFLWFFRHDVDHILEVLATTEIDEAAAIEEEDIA
ncbi:MAG: hypothetical protein MI923_02100 [Phycisphaerales bacterium]|nr:hypothetical protein [Phycisphaerales bacterium]